ncbi:MAG: hypothetical protein AAGA75_05215 [Cyanobacteria bacterium P01_E01_bin.6]
MTLSLLAIGHRSHRSKVWGRAIARPTVHALTTHLRQIAIFHI